VTVNAVAGEDPVTFLQEAGLEPSFLQATMDLLTAEGFTTKSAVLDLNDSMLNALGVKMRPRQQIVKAIAAAHAAVVTPELTTPEPSVGSAESSTTVNRFGDVTSEDGLGRPPMGFLFQGLAVPQSLEAAMRKLTALGSDPSVPAQLTPFVTHATTTAGHLAALSDEPYASMALALKAALVLYTYEDPLDREQSPYFMLNKCLRERENLKYWCEYIWLLMHALKALPVERFTTLYRGCDLPPNELPRDMIEKGRIFTLSQFGSTATTVEVMSKFVGSNGTMWHMKLTSNVARDIRPFSLFPKENEVLLPPNCRFEIESVGTLGGVTIVQCTQIESADVILDLGVSDW
jgi:NAD:arginine ADP-ribosyltransferase